jgi:hypothetical protein
MVKYPAPSAPSTVVVPTTSRVHDGVLEAACVALANVGTNATTSAATSATANLFTATSL